MRVRNLEIFYFVYKHKTISAAAAALNISQPAMSKALKHAEDQFGFQLFTRTGRGLIPTSEAHRLFEDVSRVFEDVAQVRRTYQESGLEQPSEANTWQGVFPMVNEPRDGFKGLAPVGCYAPNANGLFDMIGNVWETTSDVYANDHSNEDAERNLREPGENPVNDKRQPADDRLVIKGGSYLCAPNYCRRYRSSARTGRDAGLGSSNVGFRLAYDIRAPLNAGNQSN